MTNFLCLEKFTEILNHLDTLCWPCEIENRKIYEISKNYFKTLKKNKTQNNLFFRTIGQSGSGKTTQLAPAVLAMCKKQDVKPIHFAVRKFAMLHPSYAELFNKFGEGDIREKTNGFALRMLLMCLIFAIINDFDILLEVTLLSPLFENFLLLYLDRYKFKRFYFCVAINKSVSDYLISHRQKDSESKENGRKIYTESSNFFYDAFINTIWFLKEKERDKKIIVWNAYDFEPAYYGKMKNCIETIFLQQKKQSFDFCDTKKLIESKKKFCMDYFKVGSLIDG